MRHTPSRAILPCAKEHRRGGPVYHRRILLYTCGRSLRCWRARRLLGHAGYHFDVIDATEEPGVLTEISKAVHREVAPPYVFVDHRPVGDLRTVRELVGSGRFDHLLRDDL